MTQSESAISAYRCVNVPLLLAGCTEDAEEVVGETLRRKLLLVASNGMDSVCIPALGYAEC